MHGEAIGFYRLLLDMLGETSWRIFSKKKFGIRNISIYAQAKLYFFLLQAVIRLDFLLKCSKDKAAVTAAPHHWVYSAEVMGKIVILTNVPSEITSALYTYSTSSVGNLLVLLQSTREK